MNTNELSHQRAAEFQAIMRETAAALGPNWTFRTQGDDADQCWYARGYLIGPELITEHGTESRRLFVSRDGTKPIAPRVNVSMHFPAAPGENSCIWRDLATYAEQQASTSHGISCALSRKPAAIAADITRRILPEYEDFLARAIKRRADRIDHKGRGERNAATIAAACNGRVDSRDGTELAIYAAGVPLIRVNGDSVRFEHLSCSPSQAVKIAAILAKESEAA